MASFSFLTTLSGSGAYDSADVIFCPSVTIQFRKSARIFPCAGSFDCAGISSQVKLEIGYAFLPGASVIETRKSSGIFGADAAAAVTPSSDAFKKTPAAFFTLP